MCQRTRLADATPQPSAAQHVHVTYSMWLKFGAWNIRARFGWGRAERVPRRWKRCWLGLPRNLMMTRVTAMSRQ
ncbi:MAG: hypothetical protein B7X42_05375, partial [Thiomonas sp. 14-66-4]